MKYKGVMFLDRSNRFQVNIKLNGKTVHIGTYLTDIEGAKAWDNFVIKHGLNRKLNFPPE